MSYITTHYCDLCGNVINGRIQYFNLVTEKELERDDELKRSVELSWIHTGMFNYLYKYKEICGYCAKELNKCIKSLNKR